MGQLISAHIWMGRDEKPSSTLQRRSISYTLNFSFGYTTFNTEIKSVIYRFYIKCWICLFTAESPWPLHFKHSHWWKRRSRSKFTSHYAWGTNVDSFRKPRLGSRYYTIPWDHATPNAHNRWLILVYHVWGPIWIFIEIAFGWGLSQVWLHTILEGPWPHYMILEVSWDGLWTLSFGLSQSHDHGSWLMCEVTLS